MKKIAFLFGGQGAQKVGMGGGLAEKYPAVAALLEKAGDILGPDICRFMLEGPEEDLTRTVHCQPALYVHGMACLEALRAEIRPLPAHAAAGLSLGEFTAHAAAGTFSFETGLRLVAQRALFMQEACDSTSGTMAAIIGAEENMIRDLAAETDVDIANLNSPGQVVISGETSKVALATSLARERGIRRVIPLNVAGAYHSRLMQSAYEKLGTVLLATEFNEPKFKVISNVDALPVLDTEAIRNALHEQVTGTVRWAESMQHLIETEKCELFIELGPGGVLAGLLGRVNKEAQVVSIADAESLQAALPVIREAL